MIDYSHLTAAARHNDDRADQGQGIDKILSQLGLDAEGVVEAAKQRALRIVLLNRGPATVQRLREQMDAGQSSSETLTDAERATYTALTLAWLDGAAVTARAVKRPWLTIKDHS